MLCDNWGQSEIPYYLLPPIIIPHYNEQPLDATSQAHSTFSKANLHHNFSQLIAIQQPTVVATNPFFRSQFMSCRLQFLDISAIISRAKAICFQINQTLFLEILSFGNEANGMPFATFLRPQRWPHPHPRHK